MKKTFRYLFISLSIVLVTAACTNKNDVGVIDKDSGQSQDLVAEPKESEQSKAQSIKDYYTGIKNGIYTDLGPNKPNKNYLIIEQIQIDDCGPNPDGICGWPMYLVGPSIDDWESSKSPDGKQEFYLGRAAGAGSEENLYIFMGKRAMLSDHYGPFNDYISQIVAEMRSLEKITVDPQTKEIL